MPPHPQIVWQTTLRTLCGSQTLFTSWRLLLQIRQANDEDLVRQGSIWERLELETGQVDEDTDGEKDGDQNVDEQAVRHLFDS